MGNLDQQVREFQFELAMAIGGQLELRPMLKNSISVIMRNLNCIAAAVGAFDGGTDEDSAMTLQLQHSVPRNFVSGARGHEVMELIDFETRKIDLRSGKRRESFQETLSDGVVVHGVQLGDYGLLVFLRSEPLPNESLRSIVALSDQFASACKSCVQAEALETAHLLLVESTHSLQQSRNALAESDKRYSLAIEGSNDGIWDWNLDSGEVFFSPRWAEMLGYEPDKFGDRITDWLGLVHADDIEGLTAAIDAHVAGAASQLVFEYRIQSADGSFRWVLVRGRAAEVPGGEVKRIAGSQADITSRRRSEDQLAHAKTFDSLTGLATRLTLADRFEVIQDARRQDLSKPSPYLMVLSIDRFDALTEAFGFESADDIVVEAATRIGPLVGPLDTLARLGAERFAILGAEPADDAASLRLAQSVEEAFVASVEVKMTRLRLSMSCGSVHVDDPSTGFADALRDAHTAMQRAAVTTGHAYQEYGSRMQDEASAKLEIENELRDALERDELDLHYQPIVELSSRRIKGFEGLMRWRHPTRGVLAPGAFIGVAEVSGLIGPMTNWAISQACRDAAAWSKEVAGRPPFVTVNLSAGQFVEGSLQRVVSESLSESALDPKQLKLEVTESILMERIDTNLTELEALAEIGVDIAIDDFGTGFSSLSYLIAIPAGVIKLDRSFVSSVQSDPTRREIVSAIVSLAHGLGRRVTAEGIETEEEYQALVDLGSDFGQGYLFSRPVPAGDALDLLVGSGKV